MDLAQLTQATSLFRRGASGRIRACLGKHFLSLNFRHSISITHYSSLITYHSSLITHFFTLFMGPTPVSRYIFFFFSTQLTEANIIIKKKKKHKQPTPTQEKKKKKKSQKVVKSCGCRSLHVCLFTKMPLSYELWKQSYRLAKQPFCYGSHYF